MTVPAIWRAGAICTAAVILTSLAFAASPAQATETAEVYWQLPAGAAPVNAPAAPEAGIRYELGVGNDGWPQALGSRDALACGFWYQVDRYAIADIPGLIADGMLMAGEDNGKAISWVMVYAGDCPPVDVPAPLPPVVDQPSTETPSATSETAAAPEPTDRELAHTGSSNSPLWLLAAFGGLTTAGATLLAFTRRRATNR